jgi:CbiX
MVQVRHPLMKLAFVLFFLTPAVALAQGKAPEGILLLAHGGAADWNRRVEELARTLDETQPVEVAFGMASRPSIQSAVDRLAARGVRSIVAVPLFISSHSSVVRSTSYLLGLTREMPTDLRIFAKMSHGSHGAAAAPDSGAHATHEATDNTVPVDATVPIRMTDALNHHPIVGDILIDRAREISATPGSEAVIIVAHGPVPDDDDARWLGDMKVLADQLNAATSFAAVEALTVRDDAPATIREKATQELRGLVNAHIAAGRRVLIVPLLLSYGGIEKGIRTRLEGLSYVMAERALMPDLRLAEWVRLVAK